MFKKMSPQSASSALTGKAKKVQMSKLVLWVVVALAVLGVSGTYYFYTKFQEAKNNPNAEAQRETAALVRTVGKLMELPTDETPTVATISSKEKVNQQAFFKTAENGDILLAYTTAGKAILYRPSSNKIINVAPLSINPQEGATPAAKQRIWLRVAYYNGTDTQGLSVLAEKVVRENFPDTQTVVLTNSTKKNYKKTLIVDLSGTHTEEANSLALLLGGDVSALPEGEIVPEADILIISAK